VIKGIDKAASKAIKTDRRLFFINMGFLSSKNKIQESAENPKLAIDIHYLGAAFGSQAPMR
jgi:hypothetical protein